MSLLLGKDLLTTARDVGSAGAERTKSRRSSTFTPRPAEGRWRTASFKAHAGREGCRGLCWSTKRPTGSDAGQPKELAGIYVLLVSDEGSYMTGGIHAVTGGTPLL